MKKISKKVISLILSALMLVSVLPTFAVTALAGDKVSFDFPASTEDLYSWRYDTYEENGHNYTVMANGESPITHTQNYYNIKDGRIFLKNSVIFCNDDTVRDYVRSNAWTVEFTAKANDNGDYVFYGLGGADGDFVRLDANGSFMANGIWTNVAINSLIYTDYAISYNGSSVKLYVNGIEVASINTTLNVKFAGNGTLYSALGWTDTCGKDGIVGEYKSYSISDTVFDADAYIMNKIDANVANAKPESFNAKAYHTWNEAIGGYSNVVYHRSDSTSWNNDYVGIKGFNVKIAIPNNIVLAYDGVNSVREPVVLETKSTDKNAVIRTAFLTDRSLMSFGDKINDAETPYFNDGYWRGDYNTDYASYRYNDTASSYGFGYAPFCDKDTPTQNNTGTARFWYNTLSYVGKGNNDTYYDHISEQEWDVYAGNGCKDNYFKSYNNTFILNYKPAYDILNSADFKNTFNEVYTSQGKYTPASKKAYLIAAYKMATLNVNASFGSVTNESISGVVASIANEIKSVTNEYTSAKNTLEVVDKSALAAAITVAETVKADKEYDVKYTSTSRTAFENALNNAKDALTADKTQDEVNIVTTALEEAQNKLAAAKYSVTVNVINADTDDIIGGDYDTVAYGDEYKYYYTIPAEEGKDTPAYVFYKWTKTVGLDTTRLNNTDTSLDEVVKGDVEYNLYLLPSSAVQGDSETSTTTRVRFLDKANRTIDISTAEQGATITAEEFGIEAPAVAFYNFARWECVYGNPDQVGITEVVFKAVYTFNNTEANMCNIVSKDASVKVNGAASAKVGYDTLVTLTGADAYAYCDAEGNIISAINGTTIYAPHKTTIYVTKVETVQPASATVTGYFCSETKWQGETPYKTLTVNSQYYVPAEATASECGIMVSRNGDKWTKVKSTAQGTNHEYSIAMNYSSPYTLKVKAYVVVGEDTFESDVEEIQLDAID